jgi:CheY-like chemotaxis protein/HPt (histidine-containing phosphotransfer) domain-containing protein
VVATAHDAATVKRAPDAELADLILSKPVSSSMLFDAVNTAIVRRGGRMRVRSDAPAGAISLAEIRVLVVDDSEINLEVARRILESVGAAVRVCMNGQEAVELLAGAPRGFDVVLMDVQMPVMDGNAATFKIRSELRLTLPIIALTAGALLAERQRSFDAGMTDFLSKPLDPQLLLRTVFRHVSRARSATMSGIAVQARAAPGAVASVPDWPAIEGIDSADVAARLDRDVGLFASMLGYLLSEVEELISGPPLDASDPELPARLHKLKGSAATLGAKALRTATSEAEACLKRDPGSPAASSRLREVVDIAARLAGHARTFLAGRQDTASTATAVPQPLDPRKLQELHDLLVQQDVAAIDCFQELVVPLRGAYGASFRDLSEAMDRFEFARAADLIARAGG